MPRQLRNPLGNEDTQRILADIHGYINPIEIEITADYQVPDFDGVLFLLCTNSGSITVTHTNRPKDKSRLVVIRSNGAVSVSGNGININGASSYAIPAQYDSADIEYFETLDQHILV